jgi:ketosteroid isomerase-like protein
VKIAHCFFLREVTIVFMRDSRTFRFLLPALLTFASIFAVAQTTLKPSEKVSSAEQEVRARSAEEVAAFIHNDPKELARLWSDDFVVTNPLNKFVNKKQVLGMVNSGFLLITFYDRQIEYFRSYGDTAIVAGAETVAWGGKMPNAGKTEHLRFTAIWNKQNGRWQEVARHANIVPGL